MKGPMLGLGLLILWIYAAVKLAMAGQIFFAIAVGVLGAVFVPIIQDILNNLE